MLLYLPILCDDEVGLLFYKNIDTHRCTLHNYANMLAISKQLKNKPFYCDEEVTTHARDKSDIIMMPQ